MALVPCSWALAMAPKPASQTCWAGGMALSMEGVRGAFLGGLV